LGWFWQEGVDARPRGHHGIFESPMAQINKSFLVLFFKKEPLSFIPPI
jgi:hypothetical protein